MKPGTFTQMYVHIIFAVRGRENVLNTTIKRRIFEYISGILRDLGHKPLIINGASDHVHILFGICPAISISDTVHDIKRGSTLFINQNRLLTGRFYWQEGYGGFTCSRDQLDNIYKYIQDQDAHHAKRSFREEYIEMLQKNEADFDPQYLFEFYNTTP